MIPETQTNFFA